VKSLEDFIVFWKKKRGFLSENCNDCEDYCLLLEFHANIYEVIFHIIESEKIGILPLM
jgi:hypothetical protein